jgi:cytochrome c
LKHFAWTLLVLIGACGEPEEGELLVQSYGCVACHEVPGLNVEPGTVGPTLRDIAERGYIAVGLLNTPENLVRWITAPQEVLPGTAMPDLNVTEREAWAIAAYLLDLSRPPPADAAGGR